MSESVKGAGGRVARAVLSNGLTVVASRSNGVPLFTAALVVEAGSRYDPDGAAGLANLVGGLLPEGSLERSGTELALSLESVGSSLDTATGYETTAVTVGGLVEHLRASLALLSEVVARPAFDGDDVAEGVRRQLAELADEAGEPYAVCRRNFMGTVFRGHRRANPVGGLPETVSRVSAEDVRRFHEAFYAPDRCVLAVVADRDPDELVGLSSREFESWRTGGAGPAPPPPPVPQRRRRTSFTVMDGRQVHVCIGSLGITRSDPLYYAASVLDVILGDSGGFGSRLATKLRERLGLAYVVESDVSGSAGLEPGVFCAYTASSPANLAPLVRGVAGELRLARSEPPSVEELEAAVSYLKGRDLLERETTEARAGRLVHAERHGLGPDYDDRYPSLVSSVTREDVLEAARRVIDMERCSFVTVGPVAPDGDSLLDE